ncbi:MAG: GH3 auxin-responsive promoter family protein [Candidatus Methanomethylophilaceae archaeon]
MTTVTPAAKANLEAAERGSRIMSEIDRAKDAPDAVNDEVLLKIIGDNKDTEYGRRYGFADIHDVDDYRKKVPFSTFDDYAEMVYRELEKGESGLHSVYGVNQYNKSSGTMGNPKKIPMSAISMDYLTDVVGGYPFAMARSVLGDGAIAGKTLSVVEASAVQTINGKIYCGVSAQFVIRWILEHPEMYTSPAEATRPHPETNARYLHARYGLMERDVSMLHSTFSTFLLDLFHYIENNWEMLCNDIEKGTIDESIRMPDDVRAKLESELVPMPERANELRSVFSSGFDSTMARRIWPNLSFISAVVTGTFAAYLQQLRDGYIGDLPVLPTGLTASEGAFTIPYEFDNPLTIPTVGSAFFEFLPIGEEDPSKTLTVGQLEVGGEYEVIVTTFSGLYRYRTRDAVRVEAFVDKMPAIAYLYRIDLCVNLNGEKTYEPALRKAMDDTASELGFRYLDFCVHPNTDVTPSCYSFYIEKTSFPDGLTAAGVAECLQRNLIKANPLLEYKFERNLCGPVTVDMLQDETYLLYRDKLILKGGASTQVKPVKIIMNEAQLRFFRILVDRDIQ